MEPRGGRQTSFCGCESRPGQRAAQEPIAKQNTINGFMRIRASHPSPAATGDTPRPSWGCVGAHLPQRPTERRGLRLWPVGTVLVLTLATALLVAAAVFSTGWNLLDAHGLKSENRGGWGGPTRSLLVTSPVRDRTSSKTRGPIGLIAGRQEPARSVASVRPPGHARSQSWQATGQRSRQRPRGYAHL